MENLCSQHECNAGIDNTALFQAVFKVAPLLLYLGFNTGNDFIAMFSNLLQEVEHMCSQQLRVVLECLELPAVNIALPDRYD